jgi:hypothetical protein
MDYYKATAYSEGELVAVQLIKRLQAENPDIDIVDIIRAFQAGFNQTLNDLTVISTIGSSSRRGRARGRGRGRK